MSTTYGSKRLQVRRPPLTFSLTQIGGGILILLLVLASVPFNYEIVTEFFSYLSHLTGYSDLEEATRSVYALSIGIFALFFVPALIRAAIMGLRYLFGGLGEIVRPWMPANIPKPFRNYVEVGRGFRDRALSVYSAIDTFVSGVFGKNTMFLSPAQRGIVQVNAKRFRKRIVWFLFSLGALIFVLWFVNWLSTESAGNLLGESDVQVFYALVADSSRGMARSPLIWLVILQVALGVVEFLSSMLLVPKAQPDTVPHEGSEHYRGFGHPTQIFTRLPDLAEPLAWEGFHNRVYTSWDERASAAVGDTGTFSGYLIIEQQPQPIGIPGMQAAYLLLGAGWLFTLIGYFLLLFQLLPEPLRRLTSDLSSPFLYAPLFTLVTGITAWIAVRNGRHFILQSRILFEATRFCSPAILIECVGNHARADIRVGKAVADSIESSNVVVRSDFTARFWAAELISEAIRLDEPRDLLALNATPESQRWIDFFRHEIQKLRVEKVRPVGVDLVSQEVAQIVDANVAISAGRSAAAQQARLQAGSGETPPILPQHQPAQLSDTPLPGAVLPPAGAEEWKECPECAEMVRARARKCRFCGHRFDEEGQTV